MELYPIGSAPLENPNALICKVYGYQKAGGQSLRDNSMSTKLAEHMNHMSMLFSTIKLLPLFE